jgi:purine nucleosidase
MLTIMDVDTGIDDALALAFAVRHSQIDLEAVLTVSGNVSLELVTRNTLRVLDWMGATDVPVVAGAERPLAGPVREASHWHGADGLGGASLPSSSRTAGEDAAGYLVDRLTALPGELTVVCTGPLTNLAQAVARCPEITACVQQVVLMGGAVRVPGNVTPVAEFNIYADPEAAAVVFAQSWPVTMVGLDVTRQVLLTAEDVRALDQVTSPEAILVREVTRSLFERPGTDALSLHDPLAVGVALDPTLVATASGQVRVETIGEHTRGQTVFDVHPGVAHPPSRTRVCLDVEARRFRREFFETLKLDGVALMPNRPAADSFGA